MMKKTSILLSLMMATPAFAVPALQDALPMAAYESLSKVFPLDQLNKNDQIQVETELSVSSKFYLVSLNNSVLAVSEDGRHLISGDIVDLENMVNHTEVAKRKTVQRSTASLSSDNYVRYPVANGEAKAVVYIYSDLNCGYCKRMHKEYQSLVDAGIEVRMVPFLRSMGAPNVESSDNYKQTVAMMSVQDPKLRRQLHDKLLENESVELPEANAKGVSAIEVGVNSGVAVGLQGTPHIVFPDGSTAAGFRDAQSIIKTMGL